MRDFRGGSVPKSLQNSRSCAKLKKRTTLRGSLAATISDGETSFILDHAFRHSDDILQTHRAPFSPHLCEGLLA